MGCNREAEGSVDLLDRPEDQPGNVDNIRATIDLIEREQSEKKQFGMSAFVQLLQPGVPPEICGTALCFAGWAVLAGGGKLAYEKDEDFDYWSVFFTDADGADIYADRFARNFLALPDTNIFYDFTIKDTADLRRALKDRYGIEV